MGGTQQGRETLQSFEKSAGELGVEHLDLLVLRQALPHTWKDRKWQTTDSQRMQNSSI
ncbi:hypothetical protein GCM10010151_23410 [Actinoallomurus spadix]|uniref:Uncharacterized protein n=1 Tax=Actinoallomurus spadix TaxID=79912 RepID=A0ABP3G1H6_9ACTN